MALFNNNDQHKGGLKQAFEAIKSSLNLTSEQEQKINEIFKDFREERSNIKETGGDAMSNDLRDARQQTRHELMAVLSDEQKKTMQEHLREWRNS